MPRRPKADTLPLNARRTPRHPRLPKGQVDYGDTIRVLTPSGSTEYTDAEFAIEGDQLAIIGRRRDDTAFVAAVYRDWLAVFTLEPPVVAPV